MRVCVCVHQLAEPTLPASVLVSGMEVVAEVFTYVAGWRTSCSRCRAACSRGGRVEWARRSGHELYERDNVLAKSHLDYMVTPLCVICRSGVESVAVAAMYVALGAAAMGHGALRLTEPRPAHGCV